MNGHADSRETNRVVAVMILNRPNAYNLVNRSVIIGLYSYNSTEQ